FLDVGTGTGILGIAAYYLDASKIFLIDISHECIVAAQKNFATNQLPAPTTRTIDLKNFVPAQPFDFVAANLVSRDLIHLKDRLLALTAVKQYLAISGISHENYWQVKNNFAQLPLRCLKILRGKKWNAILYRREK